MSISVNATCIDKIFPCWLWTNVAMDDIKLAMKQRSQQAKCSEGAWMLAFFVSAGAVGKWLNPSRFANGSRQGYVRFESDQRLQKGRVYATSTITKTR